MILTGVLINAAAAADCCPSFSAASCKGVYHVI